MSHRFAVRPVCQPPLPITSRLFWYCIDCREVFRPTPFDNPPPSTGQAANEPDELEDSPVEPPDTERERFLHRHHTHRLGLLKRVRDKMLSNRPVWDPMRTVYEEVSDGQESFVLKSWREDISAPRCYLLLNGSLAVVRRQLGPHFT